MTITGTSSPASGGEHLISHTLDILAGRDGKKHDFHGRQVGVCSILMAALYERVMSIDIPRLRLPPATIGDKFWCSLAPVVNEEYQKKQAKFVQGEELLEDIQNWRALKKTIFPGLIPAARLKQCLRDALAAHRYADIFFGDRPLGKEEFLSVILHANQMRDRFTILDLAYLVGVLPDGLEEIIEHYAAS